MAEDNFAFGFIAGLLTGILVGIPAGWVVAQALKSLQGNSAVVLDRDGNGRIISIVEKQL